MIIVSWGFIPFFYPFSFLSRCLCSFLFVCHVCVIFFLLIHAFYLSLFYYFSFMAYIFYVFNPFSPFNLTLFLFIFYYKLNCVLELFRWKITVLCPIYFMYLTGYLI